MPLTILGLNHKSAPVHIRERISYEGEALQDVLDNLCQHPGISEAVVVSTCNRSEFYCQLEETSGESSEDALQNWLNQQDIEGVELQQHFYQYHNEEAIQHLFRVASGLDSLVLGEPQILGQLKDAYQTAREQDSLGSQLGKLFEQTFSVAKLVRSETAIGANPISVAYAAVRLAQQIFGELKDSKALLIGAGETIELTARHLDSQGIKHISIANRNVERAQKLARQFGGTGVGIHDIPEELLQADIIISSTASPLPLLGKGTVETALKARKHRPFFMVDIAVPRDIEPEVAELDDVYLYTVDDLESVIEENRRSRQAAAEDAEQIIRIKTTEFVDWQRSRDANFTITQLRQQVEDINQDAMKKALKALEQGKAPEEALNLLSRTLTNKLLHTPSVQLRDAAAEGNSSLLEATQTLFKLDK